LGTPKKFLKNKNGNSEVENDLAIAIFFSLLYKNLKMEK